MECMNCEKKATKAFVDSLFGRLWFCGSKCAKTWNLRVNTYGATRYENGEIIFN